jgi:hypothetical protein
MTRKKRKSEDDDLGLSKQKKQASGKSFSAFNIQPLSNGVKYSDLTSPQSVPCCQWCGSTKNITTRHAAGGALGVCDRCKNGGQP